MERVVSNALALVWHRLAEKTIHLPSFLIQKSLLRGFQIQNFPGTAGSSVRTETTDLRLQRLRRTFMQAWGNAPGVLNANISAESAFH